jgi:hypothetical protein
MTNGELLKLLENNAIEYLRDPKRSFSNRHMNRMKARDKRKMRNRIVEAIVIDFINFVGASQGVDLGLNSRNIGTGL